MNNPVFIMLHNQQGTKLVPLLDESGELAMFRTASIAEEEAEKNPMAKAFGFEIFASGYGL